MSEPHHCESYALRNSSVRSSEGLHTKTLHKDLSCVRYVFTCLLLDSVQKNTVLQPKICHCAIKYGDNRLTVLTLKK